jgi:hypothetical protein
MMKKIIIIMMILMLILIISTLLVTQDYIALDDSIIVNIELKTMWNEVVVVYLRYYTDNFPERRTM